MSTTYECLSCSWQGKYQDTDASHCPECGGETADLDSIYDKDCGETADAELASAGHDE